MLMFRAGQNYERLCLRASKLNASSLTRFLGNKILVSLTDGMRLIADGLGGIGDSPAMRLTGSSYIIRDRTGGVDAWQGLKSQIPEPKCTGTRVIRNQAFKSFNAEVQFDSQEPIVIIGYTTAHLGIDISGCWATVEHHGHYALLADNTKFIRGEAKNGTTFYPIIHVTVNRHELSKTCSITFCSVKESPASNEIKEAKLEKITVEILPTRMVNGIHRRLLSTGHTTIKEPCSTGTKVITALKFETHTHRKSTPGPYRSICNGTKVVNGHAPPELGCYSVSRRLTKVQCPTTKELTRKERGDCSYTRSSANCDKGSICLDVKTPGRGIVKLATDQETTHRDCSKECTFSVKGFEAVLTCPNGEKHSIVSSEMQTSCPLVEYGRLPLWVCRMSFRPVIVYTLFAWYFVGYAACRLLFSAIYVLLKICALLFRFIRIKSDKTRGYCECCNLWVDSKYHWQRHENCRNGRCPFCRVTCSSEKLKQHAKECVQRESSTKDDEEAVTVRYIPACLRIVSVVLLSTSKLMSKATWFLGIFAIFYICIHPVYGLADTAPEEDLWQKEVDFVNHCTVECVQGEDDCTCLREVTAPPGSQRRLLSIFPDVEAIKRLASKSGASLTPITKKRSIDVSAPWSTLHVGDAYAPSYSGKHISLSWTESTSSGDHVTVNGKSEAILKLETGTGFMWEITSPSSSEKRRVFVSILEHTQEYNTRFLYATGDRRVEPWMHGRCTGDCPEKCACNSHLCHYSEYDDFTNWRCNPSWCLSIGAGCACCALAIKEPFVDWFITKWEVEYMSSPVIACVETTPEDRICQEVSAGSMIQLGEISVQFSDPTGIEKKLPREIVLFHKTPGMDLFDLSKKLQLMDGKSLCDIQSCTHGPAGDIQFFDISPLFEHDHINLNPIANKSGLNSTNSWTSWAGVTSYYTCHPGHWPDCHSTGVVDQNSEAFKNLWNSRDLKKDYFFHEERLFLNKSPTLLLKGRPHSGAGQVTALLNVQGLSMKALHIKPEGLSLDVSSCHGCYGCSQGFTCIVRVKITKPETYAVHLSSEDPELIVPSVTIIARSDTTVTQEMRFFSPIFKEKVCIRIFETSQDSSVASSCTMAKLEAQQAVLLENRRTLHSTSDANCTTGYASCLGSNFSSFFRTIGHFFTAYFGRFWVGLLIAVLAVGLVLLLVMFGPEMLSLLMACCRARKGYRRLRQFDSLRDEWSLARAKVEEEKKKGLAVKQYLEKLSKTK